MGCIALIPPICENIALVAASGAFYAFSRQFAGSSINPLPIGRFGR